MYLWAATIGGGENVSTLGFRTCGLRFLRSGAILVSKRACQACSTFLLFLFSRIRMCEPMQFQNVLQDTHTHTHAYTREHRINMMEFKVRFFRPVPPTVTLALAMRHSFHHALAPTLASPQTYITSPQTQSTRETLTLNPSTRTIIMAPDLTAGVFVCAYWPIFHFGFCVYYWQDDRHRKLEHIRWLCQQHYSGTAALGLARPAAR